MVGAFPLSSFTTSTRFYILLPLSLNRWGHRMKHPQLSSPKHLLYSCTIFPFVHFLSQGNNNHLFSLQLWDNFRGTCSVAFSEPHPILHSPFWARGRARFPKESYMQDYAMVYLLPILISPENRKLVLQISQLFNLAGKLSCPGSINSSNHFKYIADNY